MPDNSIGTQRPLPVNALGNIQTENSYNVRLSPEGRTLSSPQEQSSSEKTLDSKSSRNANQSGSPAEQKLTEEELLELQELQKRDTEVRSHEQAHLAAAGQYAAGGPSYTYQIGPNGKRYAVGGEVPIDVGKEQTPEATLAKMQIISRAALAPLNPSAADRKIAARASILSAQARREIQLEDLKESDQQQSNSSTSSSVTSSEQQPREISAPYPSQDSDSGIASNSRHMVLRAYKAQSA